MNQHPKISFVGSNVLLFDKQDGIYGENKFAQYPTICQVFKWDKFYYLNYIKSDITKKFYMYNRLYK